MSNWETGRYEETQRRTRVQHPDLRSGSTHHKYVCKHGVIMAQCRCPSPSKVQVLVECKHVEFPPPTGPVYKSSIEWLGLNPRIQILDPDGWRRNDGVTLETKITEADFRQRVSQCTQRLVEIVCVPTEFGDLNIVRGDDVDNPLWDALREAMSKPLDPE